MPDELVSIVKRLLEDPLLYAEHASGIRLRGYQRQVCLSVVDSVLHRRGLSFVVMFPRQSGKNELQAQIEAYLMTLLSQTPAEIVKVSPTWKPQSLNAMRRLQRILERNLFTRAMWRKESGYIYRLGEARIFFLSGAPEANIVGATASTLLEVDEAQDVTPAKFDKDINPMAASTNATRVFWGTAWTSATLLARELRAAREAEKRDGARRVFRITAEDVAAELPAYGEFVAGQVARLGREHPMVRTQFYSEELDAEGGLFTPARMALMRGAHTGRRSPAAGAVYAFLLDVAGADEETAVGNSDGAIGGLANPRRDSTALTIVEADLSTCGDPIIAAPTYRVASRHIWTGLGQAEQYARLVSLASEWDPRFIVVDATGIGAGLAGFLERARPGRVIPFTFTQASKSKLGWSFLAIVDAGRWKEPEEDGAFSGLFFEQLSFIRYEILPGPGRVMRWSVPDGTHSPSGELVHDDLVMSAALAAVLDEQPWAAPGAGVFVPAADPLKEMDRGF